MCIERGETLALKGALKILVKPVFFKLYFILTFRGKSGELTEVKWVGSLIERVKDLTDLNLQHKCKLKDVNLISQV